MLKRKKPKQPTSSNELLTFKASNTINGYSGGQIYEGKYMVWRAGCSNCTPIKP